MKAANTIHRKIDKAILAVRVCPCVSVAKFNGLQKMVFGKIILLTRILLGAVFVYASIDKIVHPFAFAEVIHNYRILSEFLINPMALILPWLELIIGLLLIAGVWLAGAVFWTNVLLGVFFLALLFNVARGLDISCGCFGVGVKKASSPMVLWYIFRDIVLLIMSIGLLRFLVCNDERSRGCGVKVSAHNER